LVLHQAWQTGCLNCVCRADEGPAKSGPKIRSVYMTCFHIAYSLCHILGALSYILLKVWLGKYSFNFVITLEICCQVEQMSEVQIDHRPMSF
jgi:hypothetical protein